MLLICVGRFYLIAGERSESLMNVDRIASCRNYAVP